MRIFKEIQEHYIDVDVYTEIRSNFFSKPTKSARQFIVTLFSGARCCVTSFQVTLKIQIVRYNFSGVDWIQCEFWLLLMLFSLFPLPLLF